ncbi:MAG: hypothetical protein Q8Q85_12315 [Gemmatimonadales bacterium]|nr:hypothetical protein [Gemmatimonadales bacterium]
MRSAFALLLLASAPTVVAQAQDASRRLAFDSTRADTASCEGLLVQFRDFRADQFGGNGFLVHVRNPSPTARRFDPSHFRAQLRGGRTVSFLTGGRVASEYLEGSRISGMDAEERFRQQIDIQNDPRFQAGPIAANRAEVRFLALGWSRRVSGDPRQILPMTLLCGSEPLGQINFVAEAHH